MNRHPVPSPSATAEATARTIRRHWSIETELHWVLDMAFREDDLRHRARNTAQNLTTLRHFALNIVKGDATRKLGVANSRKRAGFPRQYSHLGARLRPSTGSRPGQRAQPR